MTYQPRSRSAATVIGTVSDPKAVPASGPGALPGFEATCTKCGLVLRSSLRAALQADSISHSKWEAGR